MKTQNLVYSLMIITFVLILMYGCKKEPPNTLAPTPVSYAVTDTDGNVYNTVTIGTQVWLKEDLKTTRYRNGDPIPNVTDVTQWSNLTTGAFCYFDNYYNSVYSGLYNWYAVTDLRNICPKGWHVPTDAEWTTLINYLGGQNVAGGAMKAVDQWAGSNTGATNSSNFSAGPSGFRYDNGSFFQNANAINANWWSSSMDSVKSALNISLNTDWGSVGIGYSDKKYGYCVRCIKD